MARFSDNPAASTLDGTEIIPATQGGSDVKTTPQAIANIAQGPAVAVEFTTDADITLTQPQYQAVAIDFTDSPTSLTTARNVVFPAHFPVKYVKNSTAQTLTLKKLGQTGVTLAAGSFAVVSSGATDVVMGTGTFTGGSLTSAVNEAKGTNIASAATVNIGAATGNYVHITGTTTITAFDTIQAGTERTLVFDGALTLTHNATSLILPTGANITTAAGDSFRFRSEGSGNWKCVGYALANGRALAVPGGELIAEPVTSVSSSSGVLNFDLSTGDYFKTTATENITSITISNLPASGKAQTFMWQFTQHASAAKTVTWPSSFKWANGTAGTVSTTLSAKDVLAGTTFDQGTTWMVTLVKGFA